MSERIIVILETVAIIVLAIVVVIYAQVLWQRFQFESAASAVVEEPAPTAPAEEGDGSGISEAERMEVLEVLSETTTGSVPADERARVLETLSEGEAEGEVDMETRMQMLESLQNI